MEQKNIYQRDYHKKYSQDLIARKHLMDFVFINIKPNRKVGLDAGCNGGFIVFNLVGRRTKKMYGIDMSPGFIRNNIKYAKNNRLTNKVDFKVGDIHKLPYKDNFFDFIICSEVIEHVQNPDAVVSEFKRVLKKGGIVLVTTPNILNPAELIHNLKHFIMWLIKKEEVTHIQHFTFSRLKKTFKQFKVQKLEGVGFGAAFLPFNNFPYLKKLDYYLGKIMQPISFDLFLLAKKK